VPSKGDQAGDTWQGDPSRGVEGGIGRGVASAEQRARELRRGQLGEKGAGLSGGSTWCGSRAARVGFGGPAR
jgi:hypothetical protein